MLNGLIKPDNGRIEMRGRIGALIALGAGFNPILTGRENIYVNGSVLGLTRKEIDRKLDDIIDFAEIGEFINSPVQSYSSGMQVRLGFAVATAVEPDVLILDEVLAVGDANFQAKCHQRIGTLLTRAAVILVSHNAYHIKKNCNHAVLLKSGKIIANGLPDSVLRLYAEGDGSPVEPVKIADARVASIEIQSLSETLNFNELLKLKIDIDLYKSMRCDQGYLTIVDDLGNIHAQTILSEPPLELPTGKSEISISVGPLCLSEGRFFGNLTMLTSGGKETLVQWRPAIRFKNKGPLSIGAFYYPQAIVDVRQESTKERLLSVPEYLRSQKGVL